MADPRTHPFGHESSAIAVHRVLGVGAILAVVVLIVVVVIYFVLTRWAMPHRAQVAARVGAIPPTPRLQAHPQDDLAALRTQKHALLSGYAWTDQTHAYARIPIQRAMAIYARQHATSVAPVPAAPVQGPPQ